MTISTSTDPDAGWMGSRSRGAGMGRPTVLGNPEAANNSVLMHLRRIRLDGGGYDPGGAYWGARGKLYEAWDDGGQHYMTCRVGDGEREAAKASVREEFPNAKFYR